jgi:class 3 adenylate cyclase
VPVCASCGHETAEDANFCPKCGAPYATAIAPSREQRKTVTVVFCDVTGSTELGESTDPEALRALLARYFERMKGVVESHGGSVEKFIGDAVMAVFGVPVAHEDDALRACRAAVEMRDAFPELGIAGRIGVNTGEVVTGTEERLATGDAVNVAARLEQAADPGEVLIGPMTFGLVGAAVELGAERVLELKGKAEPVAAYPLLAVAGELERRFATSMVGREHELARLRAAFGQAVHDHSCQLFSVLGSAGVGKSRLVAEFLSGIDGRVVRGRCLSYGEGITYWPAVEILKQLGSLPDGDAARPLRALLGETEASASAEEIAWGFRKLLEQEARDEPLVVVFDDLHWAEETLLDLVEHVADLSRDAPILLLCMARPELLERRPSWGGGKWNATTVLLEPLDAAETETLLAELGDVPRELHERIVQVAEGNPLFLEEVLALVRASGGGEVEVPATIQALLAARLDQLDPAERSVLERGSVEGRTFHRGAVAALGENHVDERLVALVRKELVRPDRAQLPGDDAYRFRHLLIRDAAYDALPKATRAQLHERFAQWLEDRGGSLVELDEILGYHLEQAARYLAELGQPDNTLAIAAGERLSAAGYRALSRGDRRAAANLIERALVLLRPLRLDVYLELDLSQARAHERDPREGLAICEAAAERAAAAGDVTGEALARAIAALHASALGRSTPDEIEARVLAVLPQLEEANDHRGLGLAWWALSYGVANARGQWDQMALTGEQAIRHSPLHRQEQQYSFVGGLLLGSTPADQALERIDALLSESANPFVRVNRAWLLAMLNRLDEARPLASEAALQLRERAGDQIGEWILAEIAIIVGDHAEAVSHLRTLGAWLEANDQRALLSTYAPQLGRELCALGRHDEAASLAAKGRELGDPQDAVTQMLWRQVQALVNAHRGEHREAERLAREAVTIADGTNGLNFQGDTRQDLAEVLAATSRTREAAAVLQEAIERYEQKKNIPLARRERQRLETLQQTPTSREHDAVP